MKKILIIISLLLLSLSLVACNKTKGVESNMYVEVYDRDGNHISNIIIEEWTITRRVYDFDTSKFKGTSEDDVTEGLIFVFKNDIGEYQYSGFMKNITQDSDGLITFKGDDLRRIFDTEIRLDFTQFSYITQAEDFWSVENVFTRVANAVDDQAGSLLTLDFTIPVDEELTQFVSNNTGLILTINAWKYLKVYFAWYDYYLVMKYEDNGNISITFTKQNGTEEIKLEDFVFDKTTTEVKTNHTVAILGDTRAEGASTVFVYSSEEYFDAVPVSLQFTYEFAVYDYDAPTWGPVNFEDSFQDFDYDYVFKVILDDIEDPGNILRVFYMQKIKNYNADTETFSIHYYLGLDNEIYIDSISSANQIYPVVTKLFEDEFISGAQYPAVWELVNSRYIEYIVLTELQDLGPLDIRTLELYEKVTVFDSEGTSKVIPVSEIEWTNKGYKVKLGFKKTLLTEIIKGGN